MNSPLYAIPGSTPAPSAAPAAAAAPVAASDPTAGARSVAEVAAAEAQRADAAMSRLHEAWVRDGELTPPPQCEA